MPGWFAEIEFSILHEPGVTPGIACVQNLDLILTLSQSFTHYIQLFFNSSVTKSNLAKKSVYTLKDMAG